MRKVCIRFMSLFIVLIFCFSQTPYVFSENNIETSTSVDTEDFSLVLLIDKSGSMENTDHNEFVKDAAKLFIDLCDENSSSQIAVMSFDTAIHNSGFVTINSDEQRDYLKRQITAIDYHDDKGTDIGLGLLSAVEFLHANSASDNKKFVILFTDGYTQDLVNGKTLKESEDELDEAIEKAKEYDCRIISIGTNYNGSMKADGRKKLNEIRDKQISNGVPETADELLTIIDAKNQDSMREVVDVFEKIYASIGNRIIHTGDIEIKSPFIAEVNVIITAPNGISEAVVSSPAGNSVSVDLEGSAVKLDNATLVYKPGKAYQLIKMIEPLTIGKWTVNVTDKQSKPIINYTWMLTTKAEISMTLQQKDTKDVLVSVKTINIGDVNYKDFFDELKEKSITITDPNGNNSTVDLSYEPNNDFLSASFEVGESGEYLVNARVSDGYFTRTCNGKIEIDVQTSEKETTNTTENESEQREIANPADFGTISVWNWRSKSADISALVEVPLAKCLKAEGGENIAAITLDGTIINISTLKAGTEKVRIQSTLKDGTPIEITGQIHVKNSLIVVLFVAAALLLIAVLLFIRSRRKLFGSFTDFDVALAGKGHVTVYEVFPPHRRKFNLYDLIRIYNRESSGGWGNTIQQDVLQKYSIELKSVVFKVRKDKKSFIVDGKVKERENTVFQWISQDGVLGVDFKYE